MEGGGGAEGGVVRQQVEEEGKSNEREAKVLKDLGRPDEVERHKVAHPPFRVWRPPGVRGRSPKCPSIAVAFLLGGGAHGAVRVWADSAWVGDAVSRRSYCGGLIESEGSPIGCWSKL